MDKIVGMGNALVDVLVPLQNDSKLDEMNLPKGSMQLINNEQRLAINKSLAGVKTYLATGGSAANTMLGLSRLGASVAFIGKTGRDEYGDFFRNSFKKNGISDKMLTGDIASGVASTFISVDGERTFGTYLGAAATLKADELSLEMFKGYTYLFIEGYLVQDHNLILRAIELAKEAGLQICLDMASYNIVAGDLEFFQLLLKKHIDIVFANEEEAKAFTGKEPEEALDIISKLCSIAVVKIGAKGSLIRKGTEEVRVHALPVQKIVDTTGAGDYYAAGFLFGLTGGYSLERCGKIGSILSGNVIQVIGTTIPDAQWDEIKLKVNEIITE